MRLIFFRVSILLLFSFTSVTAQVKNVLVIRNVTVLDMRSERPRSDTSVLVSGDRIVKVSKNIKTPKNAAVVDGTGKFLIPGLWDMHVHLFNNNSQRPPNEYYFPMFLANGVTSVRDMWTKTENMPQVREWRARFNENPGTIPRIGAVGTLVDSPPKIWPVSDSVSNPEEARAMVRRLRSSGVDFFKVYAYLSRETYFAMVDEAKRLDFPFAGHVPYSITPVEASNAGQKSIEHLWRMRIACSAREEEFRKFKTREFTPAMLKDLHESFSEQKCREVAAVFVKNKTWHVPTLAYLIPKDDPRFPNDERLRYEREFERRNWQKFFEGLDPAARETRAVRYKTDLKVLKVMHEAGVPILAGTDLGNQFLYAGFSLHDELELMVGAGLTPYEALKTATVNPAVYLDLQRMLGTIEQGKLADLVLLDANPLSDISNIRKIHSVVANGRLLTHVELDAMLNKVVKGEKE